MSEDPSRSDLWLSAFSNEPWGRSLKDWVFGIPALFGPPFLAWYGSSAYPPVEGSDWAFLAVGLSVGVVAFPFIVRWRYRLMPWGNRRRFVMWHVVVALSVWVALLVAGVLYVANGAFDRGAERASPFIVTFAACYRGRCHLRVRSLDAPDTGTAPSVIFIQPWELDYFHRGDTIDVTLKPGALGDQWTLGYHRRPRVPHLR